MPIQLPPELPPEKEHEKVRFLFPTALPTTLLIGRHSAKTRVGERGQISAMIRFVEEISAARVITDFPWLKHPKTKVQFDPPKNPDCLVGI